MRKVQVAILGGGSAGLAAFKEAQKAGVDAVIINKGEDGTTCARVGCMPSKSFVQIAHDFFHTQSFSDRGVKYASQLKVDFPLVMQHVRALRDHYVGSILKDVKSLEKNYLHGSAQFVSPHVLKVNGNLLEAQHVVLATGSRPLIPKRWRDFKEHLLTSDNFFELKQKPRSLAVIGLGAVGLELGLALSYLDVKVSGFSHGEFIGGLSDPQINKAAKKIMGRSMPLFLNQDIELTFDGQLFTIYAGGEKHTFEKVLVALGRVPNLEHLGLEAVDVPYDENHAPIFNPHTMRIEGTPLYLAGDILAQKATLPQALDEGFIAGYNASRNQDSSFKRHVEQYITYTDPHISTVGMKWKDISQEKILVGESTFDNQGRAVIMARNEGVVRVYADKETGVILGSEMMCPEGEHLSHLAAFCIEQSLTVSQALKLPVYHPTLEEGLFAALKDLNAQMNPSAQTHSNMRLDFL